MGGVCVWARMCVHAEIIWFHLHLTEAQRGEDTCPRARREVRCRKCSAASLSVPYVCSSLFPSFKGFPSRESSRPSEW